MSRKTKQRKYNKIRYDNSNHYRNNTKNYTTDAFHNIGSGFGGAYDPINKLQYQIETPLDRTTLQMLYRQDWTTRKIVETIPKDATRKWVNLNLGDEDLIRNVNEKLRKLKARFKFKHGMFNGRLYGGAVIVIGAMDGKKPDKPIDLDNLDDITHLNIIDRWGLEVGSLYKNPLKEKYSEPEFYKLNTLLKDEEVPPNTRIHESRIIRFDGAYLPEYLRRLNKEWHDSILNSMNLTLKQYGTSIQAGAILFQDFITKILKLPDLDDLLMSDEGKAKLDLRIQYAIANMSSLGIVLLGEDEELTKVQTPISGLADLIDKYIDQICAASEIPRARFFGQSLGTLAGATETTRTYYDTVRSYQDEHVLEPITYLIKLILNSKSCLTKGIEPETWDVKFNSLWDETNKEVTTARKMQAQVDEIYIDKKVITPEEIAKARFGPDGYSFDTAIDLKNRLGEFLETKSQDIFGNSSEENLLNEDPENSDNKIKPEKK